MNEAMRTYLSRLDGINRHEAEYLYDEIFVRHGYLQHGLSLPEGSIVFDVGANIGMFTLFAASQCPSASVYAFEPIPPIFEKLEKNASRFGERAHLYCCGLSSEPREAEFTYYPGYTMMSVEAAYADTGGDKALVKRQVLAEQQRHRTVDGSALSKGLDDLIDYRFREARYQCSLRRMSDVIDECAVKRVDFLKIDVQRAEIDVLNGIREDHWPMVQQIAMEVHDGSGEGTLGRLTRLERELQSRGFKVFIEQDEHLVGSDRHNVFAHR